jgi:hypothetical protein
MYALSGRLCGMPLADIEHDHEIDIELRPQLVLTQSQKSFLWRIVANKPDTTLSAIIDTVSRRNTPPRHRSTFEVSADKRPLFQRLTPLAWVIIGLVSLVVVGVLAITVPQLLSNDNETELLAERLARETPVNSVAAPKAPAAPTPTRAPTRTPRPTVAAANPNDAPWRTQMILGADGIWTAPPAVMQRVLDEVTGYYQARLDLPYERFVSERAAFHQRFLTDAALEQQQREDTALTQYDRVRALTASPAIIAFDEDGAGVTVSVAERDGRKDVYDTRNGSIMQADVAMPNMIRVYKLRYSRAENRWRIAAFVSAAQTP